MEDLITELQAEHAIVIQLTSTFIGWGIKIKGEKNSLFSKWCYVFPHEDPDLVHARRFKTAEAAVRATYDEIKSRGLQEIYNDKSVKKVRIHIEST